MSRLDQRGTNLVTMPAERPARRWVTVLVVAVIVGVVLGVGDLVLQRSLPYPWANLANSGAVWAVGSFVLGAWVRAGVGRAAVGGAVLLVVAVEAYYLSAAVIQGDDPSNAWSSVALLWLVFGVIAGSAFGVAGTWCRDGRGLRGAAGTAAVGAILLGEAILSWSRVDGAAADRGADLHATAIITAVLGLVALAVAGRTVRRTGLGFLLSLPMAAVVFAAFRLAGFGG